MIYVTGDTHGLIDIEKLNRFARENPGLTREDKVIICGDFGGIWQDNTEEQLAAFSKLPFTLLWVDGNHEDYEALKKYPITEWNGGKVQMITPSIIHLMRGQVFNIEGNTILAFGGAESKDKAYRVKGIDWWPEELPTEDDYSEACSNLEKVGWKVKYVITHSCDKETLSRLPLPAQPYLKREHALFSRLDKALQYKRWYFGHYHLDMDISDYAKTVLYNRIVPLGDTVKHKQQ